MSYTLVVTNILLLPSFYYTGRYSKEDSLHIGDRIYAVLAQQFGQENIFRDISSLLPGANFRKWPGEAVNYCDILLVIIGLRKQ